MQQTRSASAIPRTGILMRADEFVSPLAARAIELIEAGFADHAHSNQPPPTRVRLSAVR